MCILVHLQEGEAILEALTPSWQLFGYGKVSENVFNDIFVILQFLFVNLDGFFMLSSGQHYEVHCW